MFEICICTVHHVGRFARTLQTASGQNAMLSQTSTRLNIIGWTENLCDRYILGGKATNPSSCLAQSVLLAFHSPLAFLPFIYPLVLLRKNINLLKVLPHISLVNIQERKINFLYISLNTITPKETASFRISPPRCL